ncbi:hypothetical protein D3C77_762500 [compost metagenome]
MRAVGKIDQAKRNEKARHWAGLLLRGMWRDAYFSTRAKAKAIDAKRADMLMETPINFHVWSLMVFCTSVIVF